jgi:Ni/Co efflux regulator RcnB
MGSMPHASHPPSAYHRSASSHVTRHTTAAHRASTHRTTARHVNTHRTVARHVTSRHVTTRHVTSRHVTHATKATHVTTHATRPSRAQIGRLRKNITAVHRFHAGVYRAPPGFHYQRWGFGAFLPAVYFAPSFWISDWLAYDLFAPPYGYVWVRYGPDALLIDEYTGEIVQADYGVFY